MEEQLNLVQKLAKIRAMAEVVSKSKRGYNYTYSDILEILAKITAGMKKYGVSLLPGVVPSTADVEPIVVSKTKFDKTGKPYEDQKTEMLIKADMTFKWVNNENPDEIIEVPWFVTGFQEDPSQAFGSGLTYCTRYFLTSYFQIAQDNDVDAYKSKQKAAEESEDRAIAEEIISNVDSMVKQFLSDNPDKSNDVKKFVSKYVKNANYLTIKEPELASKLLTDFKSKYIKESHT